MYLKTFFKETFDIRDNEVQIALLMQLYVFLLITVLLIVKPTINALFLSQLGADNLPFGYILVAVTAVISSYYYNKAVKKFSLRKVAILTLIGFSLSFLALSVFLYYNFIPDFILYLYYIGVALFAVLTTSQFWILANMVFNAREAKRLFGFIGAGAIAGGIFGGYLTTVVVSAFNNMSAIIMAAVLLFCCVPIVGFIWKIRIRKLSVFFRKKRKINQEEEHSKSALKLILESKHLTLTAGVISVGVLVARLVDFQFSDFAHKAIRNPEELSSFFGFWFSTYNVVALLIQLFLTNRILSFFGVTSTLLILPLGLALGSLLFLAFPELWVLIILKGMDGGFKQSLNKAALELSILPIPYHIKNQAKSYLDVVVDSVATGLAGLMLIFVVRRLELPTISITLIIIFFLFVWIIIIYKLRGAYFNSFRANLQRSLEPSSESRKNFFKENTINAAIRILQTGTDDEIVDLLDRLPNHRIRSLKLSIIELLKHESPKVQIASIEQLYHYSRGTANKEVLELVESEDENVAYKAMEYLLSHTHIKDEDIFRKYLDHESRSISNAALLCLATVANSNKRMANQYQLERRIEEKIQTLHEPENLTKHEEIGHLLLTIGYSGFTKFYSYIAIHFNNKDKYIVNKAIDAAGLTGDPQFIEPILHFLGEKGHRKKSIKALKHYGPGITAMILKSVKQETLSSSIKENIPKVLSSFNTRDSIRALIALLNSKDVVVRRQASHSLSELKERNSNLKIKDNQLTKFIYAESDYYKQTLDGIASIQHAINQSLAHQDDSDEFTEILIARENLIDVLTDQKTESLNSLFNLLSLKYDKADVDVVYFGLSSELKDAKANALEFLDNLLQLKLKSRVLPIIEYQIIQGEEAEDLEFKPQILDEKTMLIKLMKDRGKRTKMYALHLIRSLNDKSYLPHLKFLRKHKSKELQAYLQKVYSEIG